MTVKIQVIIAIIVIIALSIIVNMIRKKRLELRYALAWLIVGVGTLVLDCFPKLIKWISDLVGIAVSRVSIRMKQLAQELALLEKKMNDEQNTHS